MFTGPGAACLAFTRRRDRPWLGFYGGSVRFRASHRRSRSALVHIELTFSAADDALFPRSLLVSRDARVGAVVTAGKVGRVGGGLLSFAAEGNEDKEKPEEGGGRHGQGFTSFPSKGGIMSRSAG